MCVYVINKAQIFLMSSFVNVSITYELFVYKYCDLNYVHTSDMI
jgi:hypothetical protein